MAARSRLLMYGLPALAGVALVAALASIVNSNTPAATVAPRSMPPTARAEGPSTAASPSLPSTATAPAVIGALGTVEPASREVSVATRFPGVVTEVRVIDGSKVKAGDVLFVIDSALPAVTVVQRQRDLSVAEARLAQTRQRAAVLAADVAVARGIAVSAEADLDEANDLVRIADRLQSGSSITEREMVRRRPDSSYRGGGRRSGESSSGFCRSRTRSTHRKGAVGRNGPCGKHPPGRIRGHRRIATANSAGPARSPPRAGRYRRSRCPAICVGRRSRRSAPRRAGATDRLALCARRAFGEAQTNPLRIE